MNEGSFGKRMSLALSCFVILRAALLAARRTCVIAGSVDAVGRVA